MDLAARFLSDISTRLGIPEPKLKRRHIIALEQYDWPGNVRELQNVIERAVITSQSGNLEFILPSAREATADPPPATPTRILTYEELKQRERDNLQAARWKVSGPGGAAELLGLKPTTLASRMKAFGLTRSVARRFVESRLYSRRRSSGFFV